MGTVHASDFDRERTGSARRMFTMKPATMGRAAVLLVAMFLLLPRSAEPQEPRPIDRWLLSRPFAAASMSAQGPLPTLAELNPLFVPGAPPPPSPSQLEEDLARADSILGRPQLPDGRDGAEPGDDPGFPPPPGRGRGGRPPSQPAQQGPLRPSWMARRDSVLFPERGTRVGATVWTLVRQDGNPIFDLDTLVDRSGPTATFAHVYIRPPTDRTVTMVFTGLGCTVLSAQLNERPVALPTSAAPVEECGVDRTVLTARVRLAGGWNALQIKAEGDDAPYGFAVFIAAGPDGEAVADLRIQASRPPGIRPISPQPWIDLVEIGIPKLVWRGDDLSGDLAIGFRLWGDYAPEDARATLVIGKAKIEHRFPEEGVSRSEPLSEAVSLDELRRAALGRGVLVEIKFDDVDRELVRSVPAEAILTALHGPIELDGWEGATASGRLPGSGATVTGEWKVPGWLSGFTLELLVEGSAGAYSLDGAPLPVDRNVVVLCRECEKGTRLRLEAVASDDWSSMPHVRITGPTYWEAAASEGAPPPDRWLRALEKGGSDDYRRLLAEYASTGSETQGS